MSKRRVSGDFFAVIRGVFTSFHNVILMLKHTMATDKNGILTVGNE